MKIRDIFEYNDYDQGDDYSAKDDPEVQRAFEEGYVSMDAVIDSLGEAIDDEEFNQLASLATSKCKNCTTEDVYFSKDRAEQLTQAIEDGDVNWINQNMTTMEDWMDSPEGQDTLNDIDRDRAETDTEARDPYAYRGLSKSDFR